MKLHIMGAGAMGCLWAAHLHCASDDKEISFIDSRLDHNLTPDQNYLSFSLRSPFLPHTSDDKVLRFKRESPFSITELECIFVCTKSYDALSGLKAFKKSINSETIIVLFQNGLGSQFKIIDTFPNNPVYAAVSTEGANRGTSEQIVHAGNGITRIGPLTSSAQNQKTIESLLSFLKLPQVSKSLRIQYEATIWKALWHKLVINCAINPYTALLNCPNGMVNKSDKFKLEWPALRKELHNLLNKANYPLSEPEIEELVFDVMLKTESNISSMLQDVRSHRRTEIEDINGFAARFLTSHELSNKVNHQLEQDVLQNKEQ